MSKLIISKQKCINCGACTAVCNTGALKMESESWTISYNEHLCTQCNACIKACPLRALSFETNKRRIYVPGKRLSEAYENR